MESRASVQLAEEYGWTIVSRSKDGELEVAEKAPESLNGDDRADTKQGYEEDLSQIKDEQTETGQDCKMELEHEGILEEREGIKDKERQEQGKKQENEQKEEEQADNDEPEEAEGGLEEEEKQKGGGGEDDEEEDEDDGAKDGVQEQDTWQRACADETMLCAEDSRKAIVDGKQMLVQKHQFCFLWRVSLMVVLGFFGWAVLTVDGGGGGAVMNFSGTPFLQLLIS